MGMVLRARVSIELSLQNSLHSKKHSQKETIPKTIASKTNIVLQAAIGTEHLQTNLGRC